MSLLLLILIVALVLYVWRPWSNESDSKVRTKVDEAKKQDIGIARNTADDVEFSEEVDVDEVEFGEEVAPAPLPYIKVRNIDFDDSENIRFDNGVEVSGDPVEKRDTAEIRYNGLLRNCGADGVLLHCGRDGWNDVKDIWMEKEADGSFRASIIVEAEREFNYCFKDTADHYDDNNGWNWHLRVR